MRKKEINWDEIEVGTWFTAEIEGVKSTGQIQKIREKIYLCQNDTEGSSCHDKLGFEFSWTILHGSNLDIELNDVKKLKIHSEKPKRFVKTQSIRLSKDYIGFFRDKYLQVGCQEIQYDVILEVAETIKKILKTK